VADLLMSEPTRTCCDGFTRAEALRRAASAGVAREWDPRMPVPAGAGMDRRRFLLGAAGALVSVYGAQHLGLTDSMLGDGIARAAANGPNNPILVSIFMQGGMDALSLLAPVGDPLYRKLRPTLGLAATAGLPFGEDPRLVWHPAARSFAALHDAGKVTTFPGIGYSSPDMSHFTSRHYWEVGATDNRLATGWLGRYLDQAGSAANPLQGLSLDGQMNPTLATTRSPVAAIDRPENFSLWLDGVWGDVFDWTLESAAALGDRQSGASDPALAQVARAASEVGTVRQALAPFRDPNGNATYRSPVAYPKSGSSDFPQRLAGLAAMIAGGLPLRCVGLTTDTQFDTHSGQAATFSAGVQLAADSIAAFQADLEARGIADRVLVHVWSEFGRRAQENGSGGTDHGAGGTSLLIGPRATGQMVGEFPGLAQLDVNGNLRENVDFRSLYCSLLEQWFDHDAASVIPQARRFPRLAVIK
jgi:uncharacterized protein (DUF1501 family)